MTLPPQLISFLRARLQQPVSPLSPRTGVEELFGIAGLDTMTLYQDFVTEFGLLVPSNWDFSRHVTSERLEPLHHLRRLLSARYRAATAYHDLTLGELADMLLTGAWCGHPAP